MEQVLLELSAQNEHARADSTQRGSEQPLASSDPPRPRTVRLDRDSEFRTPEGVPSARAYLPAKTVAPGRKAPIDIATVLVKDPRKLPTVRVPRDRRGPPSSGGSNGSAAAALGAPDDNAPTLRSASPFGAEPRRPETSRWIGWLVAAALFGALVVALAARFRVPSQPSPAAASAPAHGAHGSSALPRAAPAPSTPASAAAPSSADGAPTAAPEPTPRPRSGPKSDRWF